ncbi:hypothetical protein [Pedobacter sp. SYP-B3415]|uniref:hypothetical protein n=1 Tax=Pedobacter sp. SYP-B3415 TaxID=2496641 RepID=UPI00101DCF4D|nr:hypothetical protein [Pedobacter sp. SYP-B3415]
MIFTISVRELNTWHYIRVPSADLQAALRAKRLDREIDYIIFLMLKKIQQTYEQYEEGNH